jgi:hypothetical protein
LDRLAPSGLLRASKTPDRRTRLIGRRADRTSLADNRNLWPTQRRTPPSRVQSRRATRPSDRAPPLGSAPNVVGSVNVTPSIRGERPYVAKLEGDVWFVRSSLPKPRHKGSGVSGGVAEAEIAKSDGRILRVSAGR